MSYVFHPRVFAQDAFDLSLNTCSFFVGFLGNETLELPFEVVEFLLNDEEIGVSLWNHSSMQTSPFDFVEEIVNILSEGLIAPWASKVTALFEFFIGETTETLFLSRSGLLCFDSVNLGSYFTEERTHLSDHLKYLVAIGFDKLEGLILGEGIVLKEFEGALRAQEKLLRLLVSVDLNLNTPFLLSTEIATSLLHNHLSSLFIVREAYKSKILSL